MGHPAFSQPAHQNNTLLLAAPTHVYYTNHSQYTCMFGHVEAHCLRTLEATLPERRIFQPVYLFNYLGLHKQKQKKEMHTLPRLVEP